MKKDLTKENWKQIFNEYQNSNLSIADFCRLKRINNSRFYYWRIKLNLKETHLDRKASIQSRPVKQEPVPKETNISNSNFISISDKPPQEANQISFKIDGHEITFSTLPDPIWIAKLITEVKNESIKA